MLIALWAIKWFGEYTTILLQKQQILPRIKRYSGIECSILNDK